MEVYMSVQGPGGENRLPPQLAESKQDTLNAIHTDGLTKAMGAFQELAPQYEQGFSKRHNVTQESKSKIPNDIIKMAFPYKV